MPCLQYNFGLVFAMSNSVENSVTVYARDYLGGLLRLETYLTGGAGTGAQQVDPLSSQGSLVLSPDKRYLFAVNAGDNTISIFRICGHRLELTDTVPSEGVRPVSIAVLGDILYVANAGDVTHDSNITGFQYNHCGFLYAIPCSTRPLSEAHAQPACIVYSRCHRVVVVSELSTNRLSVYHVHKNGLLEGPTVTASVGTAPFGSTFLFNGVLLVSEAGPNALSSYDVLADDHLATISGSVLNGQSGTCWVSATPDARNAYTSNAGSRTITRYSIFDNGSLTAMSSISSTEDGSGVPIDSVVDNRGRNLYVLNGNQGTISIFDIEQPGTLDFRHLFTDTNLPMLGAQGLAIL